MKSKKTLILLTLVITFTFMNVQTPQASNSSTMQAEQDIRVVRVVLNAVNLSFNVNETIEVYMALENVVNESLYDLEFNFTAKEDVYEIAWSSNTTQNSPEFVYFKHDRLAVGEKFIFNMNLTVLSNATETIETIEEIEITYKIGEFRIDGSVIAPQLDIVLLNPTQAEGELPDKFFGIIESDLMFAILFILGPILIGFGLSFLFGRRQKNI